MSQMEIYWLGHAAFKIKMFDGVIIYLDPYRLDKTAEKADIIVSSHSHGDHFSKSDIKKIWKEETLLIGPISCEETLKIFDSKPLQIGDSYDRKDFSIELVPAYTIHKQTHPKANEWAGTIISSGGKSVYHAGDTERIPEMKTLAERKITVALLPCGGIYTMDFEEATDAATDIKPEILVPMHNWDKDTTPMKELMDKKDPKIKVEILDVSGEPLRI